MTDNVPDLVSNEDQEMDLNESIDNSGDDWDEIDDMTNPFICLFCNDELQGFQEGMKHLKTCHVFDMPKFISEQQLDDYSYRKFINFVRKNKPSPLELSKSKNNWLDNVYLTPVIQDDAWLMLDIEEFEYQKSNDNSTESVPVDFDNNNDVQVDELKKTISLLKGQLNERETACYLAKQQIDEMQKKIQDIVLDDDNDVIPPSKRCVKNVKLVDDEGYFNTYSHFAIHHEMLTDTVRTESYRDALITNSHIFKNCTMLDVGCGTGILSMFAAKTGCKKVFSVDQSDVIYHAMDIVRENNLNDIIELKKGRLEDIDIGVDKVDAIVSEWMGYFLLFEGMLDTVIYARDHYLKPGGKLLPNRCTLSLVGSGDTKRYIDLVDYWSNVYGFKMSCMKEKVVKEPSIEICSSKDIITTISEIQNFDLYTVDTNCVNFSSPFELKVKKTGSLTAIVGYFDVFFDLDNPIAFSTGPHAQSTHWKQTIFSLSEPISITEGETITGKLICQRHPKDIRALIVTLCVKNIRQVFYLD